MTDCSTQVSSWDMAGLKFVPGIRTMNHRFGAEQFSQSLPMEEAVAPSIFEITSRWRALKTLCLFSKRSVMVSHDSCEREKHCGQDPIEEEQ